MHDDGYELASYTFKGWPLTTLSTQQIVAELLYTEAIQFQVTGSAPGLFMPPYGDLDDRVRAVASALGFRAVVYSKDSGDSYKSVDETSSVVKGWFPNVGPGIVSLHYDNGRQQVANGIGNMRAVPTKKVSKWAFIVDLGSGRVRRSQGL